MRNQQAILCSGLYATFTQIRHVTEQQQKNAEAIRAAVNASRRPVVAIGNKIYGKWHRLSNIINGRTIPTEEDLAKVRDELQLPPSWPEPEPPVIELPKGEMVMIEGEPMVEIDIVGEVAAGGPVYNVDPERRLVPVPAQLALGSDFGFIVDGDSGMPYIEDNDLACFKARVKPQHGLPFLIRTEDGAYAVKITWFNRGEWFLRSYNPAYKPYRLPDGAQVLGYLVGWYRKKGRRKLMDFDPDGLAYEFHEPFQTAFT